MKIINEITNFITYPWKPLDRTCCGSLKYTPSNLIKFGIRTTEVALLVSVAAISVGILLAAKAPAAAYIAGWVTLASFGVAGIGFATFTCGVLKKLMAQFATGNSR